MKIRKTKKGNSIRRIVAFLLCMTMVLGLGMQDVMEQVYAEGTPVTVQEGTAQDTEKITEGEQTGDEPAAPEETTPPTEETENEGSTGDTSGDGVQDEPDAGQPGEDTNTGESGGDNTGDTGTETQPGDGSTDTSGEEGNVDTPGEGEGQGTEEGDVTVPTVPEGEEGQKPAEGDAAVPEGEEGQKPGEGDAAASEGEEGQKPGEGDASTSEGENLTEEGDELKKETLFPAFESFVEVEDGSAVVYVKAEEGVLPEGTTFAARRIETDTEEYASVENSLEQEAAKSDTEVLDFVAYDITFFDAEGNETEPNGEVQVSIEFNDVALLGADEDDSTVNVVHVKEDASTEEVQSDIDINAEQLNKVEFSSEEFSVYAVTVNGISKRYNSNITAGDYAVIEFWDKNGNQDIEFVEAGSKDKDERYLRIKVYLNGEEVDDKLYRLDMSDDEYDGKVNLQTTVKPGEGYYLAQACEWSKAGSKDDTFGGSGSTGMNKAGEDKEENVLEIYLTTQNPNGSCTSKVENTKNISVDLYNYDTEAYNEAVGLNSGSLLLRSAWGNYKADGYGISDGENNGHNESCGKRGIYYGLAEERLENGNIKFTKNAKFFDDSFDSSIGTKYSDVDFEFVYNENTNEYRYSSEENHVHFNGETISQYTEKGPGVLPDGSDFTKDGFFPFTDEDDNMADYGFGMRMDVDFQLNESGTIDGTTPMTFSFSGDDDVWVFIDGQLVLDLGGLHSRRGGTIDFAKKEVTYDKVTYNEGEETIIADVTSASDKKAPDLVEFWNGLEAGKHTLTMYYLERGGNDSNCEIKFNLLVIEREGTLEFNKVDEERAAVPEATFGLYDTYNITDQTEPLLTAVSDSGGKVSFDISSLSADTTYYLKEISAPFGYISDENIYTVSITENNTDHTKIVMTGSIKGIEDNQIVNEKYTSTGGTTSVTVKKEWEDGLTPTEVSVTLWANREPLPGEQYTVSLNEGNDWSHTWNNLPGDTVYEVKENNVPENVEVTTDEDVEYTLAGNPYTIRPCNVFEYTLTDNAVVLIFSGSEYHAWTPVEIGDKESFYTFLNNMKKGGPDTDEKNTEFYFGTDVEAGFDKPEDIQFTYDPETKEISLTYVASKAWSWFCIGNYDKNATITLTNGIDKDATIDIPVEKKWYGDTQFYENIDSVTVQLMRNGVPVDNGRVEITRANEWRYTFEDQPYYFYSEAEKQYKVYDYSVVEIEIGNMPVENVGCEVEVVENPENTFVIKNMYYERWEIYKIGGNNKENVLEGAKFTLKKEGEIAFYGQSDSYGIVTWWKDEADVGDYEKAEMYIPAGTYILEETEPPLGYQKSNIKWTITIDEEDLTVSIVDENGDDVPWDSNLGRAVYFEKWFYYNNEIADYELPSTGGPGIHLYMLGGTLLLMAGSLLVYKKRKKEVLGS